MLNKINGAKMIQLPKTEKEQRKRIFFMGKGGQAGDKFLAKIFRRVYWPDAAREGGVAHTCENVISENKILIAGVYGSRRMPF